MWNKYLLEIQPDGGTRRVKALRNSEGYSYYNRVPAFNRKWLSLDNEDSYGTVITTK